MRTTTAHQLIKDAACTPACLVAAHHEAATCSCRCGGTYHAKLATTELELAHRRPPAPVMAGQLALDL